MRGAWTYVQPLFLAQKRVINFLPSLCAEAGMSEWFISQERLLHTKQAREILLDNGIRHPVLDAIFLEKKTDDQSLHVCEGFMRVGDFFWFIEKHCAMVALFQST
jgi:hypothetical protein